MRPPGSAALLGALLAGLVTTSCAAPTGDFGRPRRSLVHDSVLPTVGSGVAWLREEPVSGFELTDAEEDLRDRTYRFIMPIHRRGFFARTRVELIRTRIWPDSYYTVDPAAYYWSLRADRFRSEAGRYGAIRDEIVQDNLLLDPYLDIVNEVYAADAARMAALDRVQDLTEAEEASAIARVYENRRVVTWAVAALRWRVASYRYALERTTIELPSAQAADVERALFDLARRVEALGAAVEGRLDAPPAEPLVVKA